MIVLGLTGGIAMGKSTASAIFRSFGVPVFDADAAVHELLAPGGGAIAAVEAAFPGCRDGAGGIDRAALGRRVFGHPAALRTLEAILHPRVRAMEARFLARCRAAGAPLAVLDIPLLLETGGERRVDAVAVVSAPAFLQAHRVLRRRGMTEQRLAAIRARQMSDGEKRRRADFVIPGGLGRRAAIVAIARIVDRLRGTGLDPGSRCPSSKGRSDGDDDRGACHGVPKSRSRQSRPGRAARARRLSAAGHLRYPGRDAWRRPDAGGP